MVVVQWIILGNFVNGVLSVMVCYR